MTTCLGESLRDDLRDLKTSQNATIYRLPCKTPPSDRSQKLRFGCVVAPLRGEQTELPQMWVWPQVPLAGPSASAPVRRLPHASPRPPLPGALEKRATEVWGKREGGWGGNGWREGSSSCLRGGASKGALFWGGTKVTEKAQNADFSQKTADFRRFTLSPGNSSIWRAQETADFPRKPQETADWAPSPGQTHIWGLSNKEHPKMQDSPKTQILGTICFLRRWRR